jgi:catechol 2,3-dioxygenase
MPVIFPAPNPPFNIVRLSHVELGVADLAASRHFYVETLGLIETEQVGRSLYLRGLEERNHHSIVLSEAQPGQATRLGFKVSGEADLDLLAAHFTSLGLPANWVERQALGRVLLSHDPFGTPLEFYFKMEQVARNLQKYGAYQGVQPLRIDHVNCFSPNVQASHEFYTGALGFRATEYTEAESGELWAIWLHRKGNVHDLALTNGRGPRLHHVALWVPAAMQIIHLCDVLATTGYLKNMERGPGRHGISNAFFLYIRDPDGHRLELFSNDYMTVDPDFEPIPWKLHDPQRQTLWGAPAPKSWFEEGSPFAGVPQSEPALPAAPIVAPW